MRETGIVRRIDELGRVVIPKEIRKTQRIRTGDSLEIYTDGNGEVIFKKYSPLAELGEPAAVIATGGLGGCIIPYCRREITYDKNLLLNGLWALYQKNKRKR